MSKPKRKLTAEERRRRRERKKNFEMIFVNGKQKWVPREPLVEGLPVDEFIAQNADPIWLHQHELWELMYSEEDMRSDFHAQDGDHSEERLRGFSSEEEPTNPF